MWLIALLAFWIAPCVDDAGAALDPGSVSVWVAGQTNGGVSKPAGTSTCTPWEFARANVALPPPYTRVAPDGVVETVYGRVCDGIEQFVWVRALAPRDLARAARDEAVAKIPKPSLATAPPTDRLIVNLESWFGVTPMAPVSATASIPGASATVTARPRSIRLVTGSTVPGDQRVVECGLWGSSSAARNGCTWTPRFPSIPSLTGAGYAFHGSITVRWEITWTSTSGAGGTLDDYDSTTAVQFAVREIQTVGARG